MKKLKVGVIGFGQRGSGLTRTLLACEEAEIVAVCDAYQDRMERAQKVVEEKSGVKPVGYIDYKQLLVDPNVEAVLVASSWDEHIRMAIESMRAGKITAMEVGGAGAAYESAENMAIGALLAGIMFFWVLKKETALAAANEGAKKLRGNGFYYVGKYAYCLLALLALVLGCVLGAIG